MIRAVRTPSGQRLFDLESFTGQAAKTGSIVYARVSSAAQRADLEQVGARRAVPLLFSYLADYADEVIKDVGSGLNYKRRGLRALLERAVRGDRIKLVVAHRDRLARFGSELIEHIIKQSGGELVVLDQDMGSAEDELAKDLLHSLHVFSCRMYGRRQSSQSSRGTARRAPTEIKENPYLSGCSTEALIEEVVRRLQKGL